MAELIFEVGDHKYRAGRLDIFQQAHVVKRITAALGGVVTPDRAATMLGLVGAEAVPDEVRKLKLAVVALPAVAEAFQRLSDEDADVVLKTCLGVVSREQNGGWAKVLTPGGDLMFGDLDLPDAVQISWRVVEPYLQRFFPTSGPGSSDPPAPRRSRS